MKDNYTFLAASCNNSFIHSAIHSLPMDIFQGRQAF